MMEIHSKVVDVIQEGVREMSVPKELHWPIGMVICRTLWQQMRIISGYADDQVETLRQLSDDIAKTLVTTKFGPEAAASPVASKQPSTPAVEPSEKGRAEAEDRFVVAIQKAIDTVEKALVEASGRTSPDEMSQEEDRLYILQFLASKVLIRNKHLDHKMAVDITKIAVEAARKYCEQDQPEEKKCDPSLS